MKLESIPQRKNRVTKAKRLGRGYGSGVGGHTVGRGQKGQKSRSGHKSTVFFEGGNVPFFRRMPKFKGFKTYNREANQTVNVGTMDEFFKNGEVVSLETLKEKGIIKKKTNNVKILGEGEIKNKVSVEGLNVSAVAEEKIIKAGGTIK